jgi:hypothetical protein
VMLPSSLPPHACAPARARYVAQRVVNTSTSRCQVFARWLVYLVCRPMRDSGASICTRSRRHAGLYSHALRSSTAAVLVRRLVEISVGTARHAGDAALRKRPLYPPLIPLPPLLLPLPLISLTTACEPMPSAPDYHACVILVEPERASPPGFSSAVTIPASSPTSLPILSPHGLQPALSLRDASRHSSCVRRISSALLPHDRSPSRRRVSVVLYPYWPSLVTRITIESCLDTALQSLLNSRYYETDPTTSAA